LATPWRHALKSLRFGTEHARYVAVRRSGAEDQTQEQAMSQKTDVVLIGVPKKLIVDGLSGPFNLHVVPKGGDAEAIIAKVGANVRAAAVTGAPDAMRSDVMARLPKLEVVSSFGVGYDNIDVKYAVEHKIVVC